MRTVEYAKVAQAVDCCAKCSVDACNHCPYITEGCDEPDVKLVRVPVFLLEDVGELLKEKKYKPQKAELRGTEWWCPRCKNHIEMFHAGEFNNYCAFCGQAVKFE